MVYHNTLADLRLTAQDIEQQIGDINLVFSPIVNDAMEWRTMPPPFARTFYKLVTKHQRVPNQEEFWAAYCSDNSGAIAALAPNEKSLEALKARALRAYPSLVRDLHFYCLLRDSGHFEEVTYDIDIDVQEGVDIIVKYAGQLWGIHCYAGTERGLQGREKKRRRHHNAVFQNTLDVVLDMNRARRCGQFYLYGTKDVEYVVQTVAGRARL